MNPRAPLFIVSKGRADSRLTSKALERMGVPYRIVVEESERAQYEAVIDPAKVLILDPEFQRRYETCDDLGETKSKGPGAARNFVWEVARSEGHAWHWVMDDNIRMFCRLNHNIKTPVADGTIFRCMEDFAARFSNVMMAGPNYFMFAARKTQPPPFVTNTRIYSCNLIRTSAPFYWRGRYNEDTDLSLRMLKAGFCTIQFNAFLQYKMTTQTIKGGCDADFYSVEGTMPKSRMLVDLHPDVATLTWRFDRWHHYVDYTPFARTKLQYEPGLELPAGIDNYGMELEVDPDPIELPPDEDPPPGFFEEPPPPEEPPSPQEPDEPSAPPRSSSRDEDPNPGLFG